MKIKWTSEILAWLDFSKLEGKTLKELQTLLFITYGVQVSCARISQVIKAYRAQFKLKEQIEEEDPF